MLLNGVSYLYTILMVSLRLLHKLLNSQVKEYNDCAKAIIFFLDPVDVSVIFQSRMTFSAHRYKVFFQLKLVGHASW